VPKEDECDIFGKLVAGRLRSMKNKQTIELCKLKLMELMYNFEFGVETQATFFTSEEETYSERRSSSSFLFN